MDQPDTRDTRSPSDPPLIGLIANPYASKDIRRLVGLARVVDVEEKANLIARLLAGMTAGPPVRIAALDDSGGLVRRALRLARTQSPPVEFLPLEPSGTETDTRLAAAHLADLKAAALVTVGGDGTIRSAVEGWPTARLVPLAAGTNNAVAISEEATVVGYGAALAASDRNAGRFFDALTTLSVDPGDGSASRAVVDVVGVRTRWTGARALWEPKELVEAVVANVRPTAVGVASIAAGLGALPSGHARYIRFGHGRRVRAVLGPGLVGVVSVAEHRILPEGTRIGLDDATRVVALDGERRIIRSSEAFVDVGSGPRLLSVERALESVPFG